MATSENTQDPLGLKRFALTESAYDLVNSLTGLYAGLIFKENQQSNPDTDLILGWRERVKYVQSQYHHKDWNDLAFLEKLTNDLSSEYKEIAEVKANQISQEPYATHISAKVISAS